jgi:hypothetical protein
MDPTSDGDGDRRALRTYLVFAGVLVTFVLIAAWTVEAREKAAARGHRLAVAASAADPGTPVPDPTLPAGVVEVDLVPIHEDLALEELATLRVGARHGSWTPDAPVRFEGLTSDHPVPLFVRGPYAAQATALSAPTGAHGVRVSLRAVPLSSAGPPRDRFEKRLEIALRTPESVALTWKVGLTVVADEAIPRASAEVIGGRIRAEWKQQGAHFDVADRRRDRAIVRVGPGDTFDDIVLLAGALLLPEREMREEGVTRRVPVFWVSVQPPG